jgi:hypothetical protein
VSCIYRPKFVLTESDIDLFDDFFKEMLSFNKIFFAAGDFNIHLENTTDRMIKKFNSLLHRHNVRELIQQPTRNNARLDIILTNDENTSIQSFITHPISDHQGTYITRPLKIPKRKKTQFYFRPYNSCNWTNLSDTIYEDDNFNLINDLPVTDAFAKFTKLLVGHFDNFCPITSKFIRQKTLKLHASAETTKLKLIRNKLYSSYKKQRTASNLNEVRQINKLIHRRIVQDTKDHLDKEIKDKGLWEIKKRLINERTKVECTFDPEQLNDYYCSIFNSPITISCPTKPSLINHTTSFKFTGISLTEFLRCYKSMNNRTKTNPDCTDLAPIMIRQTINLPNICNSLHCMISKSFLTNEFPAGLKMSAVTPLPKIDNPTEPSHFRPISTQPFLSLLTEKCAKLQLTKYINDNDIMYKGQFGFRKGHSCETAMIALTEFMYREINLGKICLLLSLDIAKGFDTIIREFLYEKLGWYGIDPTWFKSYMSYRCQFVKGQNGKTSSVKFTLRGTCQGSVLGPLIFSIYINDLPLVVKNCLCILFADDSQLILSGHPKNIGQLLLKLKTDLEEVIKWMNENGLSLNLNKTQFIIIGNAHNIKTIGQVSFEVDGTTIINTDTIKTLGLTLDSKLKWYDHINKLSRSYHLAAKSLLPLKPLLSQFNFKRLFNACVQSLCNYMSIIYGNANLKTLKILEKAQRFGARLLLNKSKFDPVKYNIYNDLKWFLPHDNYQYKCLIFMYSVVVLDNLPYFGSVFLSNREIHTHQTRSNNNLHRSFLPRNDYGRRSLAHNAVIHWNDLSVDVRQSASVDIYKHKVKNIIIQKCMTKLQPAI